MCCRQAEDIAVMLKRACSPQSFLTMTTAARVRDVKYNDRPKAQEMEKPYSLAERRVD